MKMITGYVEFHISGILFLYYFIFLLYNLVDYRVLYLMVK